MSVGFNGLSTWESRPHSFTRLVILRLTMLLSVIPTFVGITDNSIVNLRMTNLVKLCGLDSHVERPLKPTLIRQFPKCFPPLWRCERPKFSQAFRNGLPAGFTY